MTLPGEIRGRPDSRLGYPDPRLIVSVGFDKGPRLPVSTSGQSPARLRFAKIAASRRGYPRKKPGRNGRAFNFECVLAFKRSGNRFARKKKRVK
ncbi:hypothetical protein CQ10_08485 [Bradyrhizobium valentinum]|nr:hypothetical protein CQ10_08485 [Bradyrhizobium valentinum]